MSILPRGHGLDYLHDLKDGKIQPGLGIGNQYIDQYLLFKKGQLNMVLGYDNVGKTYWILWYFLCLSMHHGLKWTIWTGENKVPGIKRSLIQLYARKNFLRLDHAEITRHLEVIDNFFSFVDNNKGYTHRDLLNIYGDQDSDGYLIDPYTGLKRGFGHQDNYDFLNETREWLNKTQKTIYVNSHPGTQSGRNYLWPKGHDMAGFPMPPKKADIEGGLSFANRADDFIVLHRYVQHPVKSTITEVHVVKNKDNDTGGGQTMFESPIYCEFNNGLGFQIGGMGCFPDDNKPKPFGDTMFNARGAGFEAKELTESGFIKPDEMLF
jgi:hypothetical protein